MTGNEAEFVLNQSCIDVERLLLRAISCNIHTRLLEVQRVLKSNGRLCQAEDDIILKHPGNDSDTALNKISDFLQKSTETDVEELGEELLCVRAYGLSYVVLGITIRNGRFLLPSRNLILSSAITECEEALNQGSLSLTEVFISLRNKSILHLFASTGSFLGLKFLEDFIDRGEVERLLDCIRLTAGPLHALSDAIRPARMVGTASTGIALVASGFPAAAKTNELMLSQGGPGIVPSSLLPTDVSVVLRSPCWIRIFYRKKFAVDMRCSVGDQIWLQPAIPPKGGPAVGGSMLCPQFQKVILKYVAFGLNTLETSLNPHLGGQGTSDNSSINIGQSPVGSANRVGTVSPGISRATPLPRKPGTILNRVTNVKNALGAQHLAAHNAGMTLAEHPMTAGTGVPVHLRGDLNTVIKRGNDSGYGGAMCLR